MLKMIKSIINYKSYKELCPTNAIKVISKLNKAKVNSNNDKSNNNKFKNKTSLNNVNSNLLKFTKKDKIYITEADVIDMPYAAIADRLSWKIKKVVDRTLHIREVDSGDCNACDYEITSLNKNFTDIERLGLNFEATMVNADILLVTGNALMNVELSNLINNNSLKNVKAVIAVGACACNGEIFRDVNNLNGGIDSILPVDIFITGCPPKPQALIYGILKALDRF